MMTVLCILLFVFTVNLFWPRGAELLEEFLFPKSSAIAVVAVEELAMDLEDGLPVGTAITSFLNKLEGK